ncbi:hypothetical protein HMPREF0208_03525 [Citrobacter koseri]|nr:hypothetical protein HMPREF3207_01894 [Citrobacter koseri]KXA03698.1 hypothetical protein HMPREF3220_00594 [Citrobacter koseri]KXB41703.1 hypothetical protein HMPREF0208_03525 [Citrobacter koseri]
MLLHTPSLFLFNNAFQATNSPSENISFFLCRNFNDSDLKYENRLKHPNKSFAIGGGY